MALTRHTTTGLTLAVGMVAGILLGGRGESRLQAGGGDRPDSALVVTGAITTEYNKNRSVQLTKDAVYYLNYSKGRLLASVPMQRQTATATQIMSEFAERDLVADFQLAPGTNPHFVMTTATLGALDGEGWSPLIVFETTSGQMAVYRAESQSTSGSTRPAFRLLERTQDARLAHAVPALAARP